MQKEKLLNYSVLIKNVKKNKDDLIVLMSLCSGKDMPFYMKFKFTGKELCDDLLKDRTLISVRASGTRNKIILKSITLIKFEKSKNGKSHSIHKTYSVAKNVK